MRISECYDFAISDTLDESGDISFTSEGNTLYLEKSEAILIIEHLQKVFELDKNHVNVDNIEN